MKRTNSIIFIALLVFDVLYYRQIPGINVLLFNIILLSFCIFRNPELKYNHKWLWAASGALITSICVFVLGDTLSFLTNIIALIVLSASVSENNISVLTSIFGASLSYIISPYICINNSLQAHKSEKKDKSDQSINKTFIAGISIVIVVVFFIIYQNSSLIFYHYTKMINFQFITWSWILFTVNGFLLLVAFFNYRSIGWLYKLIDKPEKSLTKAIQLDNEIGAVKLTPSIENYTGILLLSLLNGLLLLVNCFDFSYFINKKLPLGVTYSEYVHQGVGIIIISIVLAIAIIFYLFRGNLNFFENNKLVRYLAYAWVIQNMLMILSTILRNSIYIEVYGLTEKRIGVYFYLALAIIGLATTLLKIYKKYSNAYLVRLNAGIFFIVMILSCFVSWDKIITSHNLSRPDADKNFAYLSELSDSNIPQLLNFLRNRHNIDSLTMYSRLSVLNKKMYEFLEKNSKHHTWQSWNLNDNRILNQLKKSSIKDIYLENFYYGNLNAFLALPEIEDLTLVNCYELNINNVVKFQRLKRLVVHKKNLLNLSSIGQLKDLQYLDLTQSNVLDYAQLYPLKKLKTLKIDNPGVYQLMLLKIFLKETKIIVSP